MGGGIGKLWGWAPYIPTNNNKTTKLQDMISSIKSTWNLKHLFMIIEILLRLFRLDDSKSFTWEIAVSLY